MSSFARKLNITKSNVSPKPFASGRFLFACLLMFVPLTLSAQTFTTLVNFSGSNGSSPMFGSLIQARDGNFYGTTSAGGAHKQGTVFKVTPQGTMTALYNFCLQSGCTDGSAPYAGVIQGKDGNFYGTTESGGAHNEGTVFKLTPQGSLTVLHSFNSKDGANPYASLIQAANGNFYGTTESGGSTLLGTVFVITPQGTLTTIHTFKQTDGADPEASLIKGADGNFYGTTYLGGSGGYGTAFRMTPAGALTTIHNFEDETEGRAITAGLVQSANGLFYGSTTLGGPNGFGAVFSMTSTGTLTVLHGFNATDGATPNQLILASDGNLYGTTIAGGSGSDGIVFQVTPQGAFMTLHAFVGTDGADSFAGLVQGKNRIFYGTTRVGGTKNNGTVFSVNLGL